MRTGMKGDEGDIYCHTGTPQMTVFPCSDKGDNASTRCPAVHAKANRRLPAPVHNHCMWTLRGSGGGVGIQPWAGWHRRLPS